MKFFKERDHKEFFRHHSIYKRTIENGMLFMYGLTRDDIAMGPNMPNQYSEYRPPFERRVESIWEFFKKQGFITGYVGNICESNIFLFNDFISQYMVNNHADHENVATTCDPHLYDYNMGTD